VDRRSRETERLREQSPLEDLNEEGDAVHRLLVALGTLHLRVGQPTAYTLAVLSSWDLTPEQITSMLNGTALEDWHALKQLLYFLGGDREYFRGLWDAARDAVVSEKPAPDAPSASLPCHVRTVSLPRSSGDGFCGRLVL
jgi:hypothetical protein